MFGLGSLTDLDSLEIRDALFLGLKDLDHEIRGEAMVGLAIRKDSRVFNALLKEWELDIISILSLEAAEELADPKLIPHLQKLLSSMALDENNSFSQQLNNAISACQRQ